MANVKKKTGKSICIFSGKGGVGKTITTLNLAGIYEMIGKKVLIIDLDLASGNIALCANKPFQKTIYNFVDDYNNNRFHNFNDYVTHYDNFIDILPSPKDPRQASKIDSKYIEIAIDKAEYLYDVVLIDILSNHGTELSSYDIMCIYEGNPKIYNAVQSGARAQLFKESLPDSLSKQPQPDVPSSGAD